MGVLPDSWIKNQALTNSMIDPFVEKQVSSSVVSYGLSSYGYDVKLCGEKFFVFTENNDLVIDPKAFNPKAFDTISGTEAKRNSRHGAFVVPPNSFALGRTHEYIKVPRDVLVICLGKSTYARCGIIVNVTPLEPEWEGFVTLEISNTTKSPALVYPDEGIAQFIFLRGESAPLVSYAQRKGKYMHQRDIVLPKVSQ